MWSSGVTTADSDDQTNADPPEFRHVWEMARPDDPDVLPLGHRLLRAVSERIRWRNQLDHARNAAPPAPQTFRQLAPPIRPGRRAPVDDELLTVPELALGLKVEVRFVRRLVAERRIPFYKVGKFVRFYRSDVAELSSRLVESRPSPCRGPAEGRWRDAQASPVRHVRKLPSGRFQASFIPPGRASGRTRPTPSRPRPTPTGGWRWSRRTSPAGPGWTTALAAETFGNYARAVLRDSPKIGVRWRETCERNLRLHLAPLSTCPLRALVRHPVREWHAAALRGDGGRTSISQSYRFLRMVMNIAVREGIIARNPCQIPGAGTVKSRRSHLSPPRPRSSPWSTRSRRGTGRPCYRGVVRAPTR